MNHLLTVMPTVGQGITILVAIVIIGVIEALRRADEDNEDDDWPHTFNIA